MDWYFRFADRTHPLLAPVVLFVVSGIGYLASGWLSQGGVIRETVDFPRMVGTLALFCTLPSYLLGMMYLLRRQTERALAALEPLQAEPEIAAVRHRLDRLHPFTLPGVLIGVIYGALQNSTSIRQIFDRSAWSLLDITFIGGNCFVWATVALVLCWRLPVSLAMSRLGAAVPVDIYRLDRLKPLARVATTDILVVAGGMVLMPLQSLDAEFHFENYQAGFYVGVPAAIVLFMLPLLGLYGNIKRNKDARLRSLRARLDEVVRDDVVALEMLTAHIDRVRAISNWPIDVQTLTRVFAYVIIPPLAWVGAALVEKFVDRF